MYLWLIPSHNVYPCRQVIEKLEHSIASYKEEYAVLIAQAQAIKTDLASVQAKVMGYGGGHPSASATGVLTSPVQLPISLPSQYY